MPENIVQGLFGLQPWQIQQQQNQGLQSAAEAYGNQTPAQRINSGFYQAGGMLGNAAAQGMGMVNPQVQQAQMQEAMTQGIDFHDPVSIRQRALQIQDPRMKFQLEALARQAELEQSRIGLERAQAGQATAKAQLDYAQAARALRENPNLHEIEVGVEGKPDYRQKMIIDKTNPNGIPIPVGPIYQIPAGVKNITNNPAPITPISVIEDNPKSKYFGKTVLKDGRTGETLGLASQLGTMDKAELKLQQSMPAAQERVGLINQNYDKLNSELEELKNHPGLPQITGSVYGRTPNVSDNAINADAKLKAIQAQTFASALQSMRESSKTGGAVGNVSDREGDKLERMMGSLDRVQSTQAFKDGVTAIQKQIKQSKAIIQAAYDNQYQGIEPFSNNIIKPTQPTQNGGGEKPDGAGTDAGYENWKKARGLK